MLDVLPGGGTPGPVQLKTPVAPVLSVIPPGPHNVPLAVIDGTGGSLIVTNTESLLHTPNFNITVLLEPGLLLPCHFIKTELVPCPLSIVPKFAGITDH